MDTTTLDKAIPLNSFKRGRVPMRSATNKGARLRVGSHWSGDTRIGQRPTGGGAKREPDPTDIKGEFDRPIGDSNRILKSKKTVFLTTP